MNVVKYLIVIMLGFALQPAFVRAQETDGRTDSGSAQVNSKVLAGFFQNHCVKCHGPEKPKGKLRLDMLNLKIGNRNQLQQWQEILGALKDGKMPPEDEPRRSTSWRKKEFDSRSSITVPFAVPAGHR